MQKTFILDTNVLIHDPESLFAFSDNKVVIPMTVIEELDKVKKFRDEIGHNTRMATRKIDSLREKGSLYKGVKINDGGIFKIIQSIDKNNWPVGIKYGSLFSSFISPFLYASKMSFNKSCPDPVISNKKY